MITEIQKIGKGEITLNDVQDKIITIRNKSVLLDSDVAWLYGVETKEVNQAVKNNPGKFPEGYIFTVQSDEKQELVKSFDQFNDLKHSTFLCKSRSDGTLLTVSFNLRNRKHKSRSDGTLQQMLYRSRETTQSCVLRRLKSTVNRVSSLRDLFGQVA